MDPTGYIMAFIIMFGPVLALGAWLGSKITDFKVAQIKRCTAREYRACTGCRAIYHESWNGPGEEKICPSCSGAD